jgi:hypothetical protein
LDFRMWTVFIAVPALLRRSRCYVSAFRDFMGIDIGEVAIMSL